MTRRGTKVRVVLATVTVLVALVAASASLNAASWTSHVNASLVSDIVIDGSFAYITTYGGLVVFDLNRETFSQFTTSDRLPSNSLNAIVRHPNGSTYVATDDVGIAELEVSAGGVRLIRVYSTFSNLASQRVTDVAAWGEDVLYGTDQGAGKIVGNFPAAIFDEDDGLPSNNVTSVLSLGEDAWVATDAGLARINSVDIVSPIEGSHSTHLLAGDRWECRVRRYRQRSSCVRPRARQLD